MFVRVRDPETKHEFDIDERSRLLTEGLVERVKPVRFPPAFLARRAKHHLSLTAPASAVTEAEPSGEASPTEKE